MRTSEEVYHQVRWDPRFDPARFVLGVRQRGARTERVALPAFAPGGEVPWHRVVFVEADGEVVWDRAAGLDRVDESGAGRVRAPRLLRAPLFTPSTPHAWDPLHGWTPTAGFEAAESSARQERSTTVLTWNVLWDRYDGDRIDTARRRPLLVGELAAADADVIALQEVEPDLLAVLLAQPWVRAAYAVDVDPRGPDVDRTGLVVLSRLPVLEAARFPLGAHKAVSAVVVETGDGPLVVAATHLTSDHTANGAAKRRAQLGRVAEAFAGVEADVVLVGDFNDGSRRTAAALGMRDVWLEARDDEPPTFDPVANPLAAVSSLTGRPARLDRVFARGRVRCAGAELVGDRPVDGLFASDHYGVLARLAAVVPPAGVLDSPPTPRTAVVWLPGPGDVDRRHVALLSGFVPESDFERAVALLSEAVAEVRPDPADSTPSAALRDVVRRLFPSCTLDPHLPLDGSGVVAERIGAGSEQVVVLSRRGDGPMLPRAAVAPGTGEVRWFEEPATAPGPSLDAVADRVTRALSGVLDVVHVVGSRRMGCGLPDADLDLVAEVAEPATVASRVAAALPGSDVRPVVGARSPGLRLVVAGLGVDLAVAGDDGAALSAVGDAEAVSAAVGERHADFARLAREVKAWARARGLDSAPFGGVPGVGWAVLAARTVREWDGPDLLSGFFGAWAAWDWRDPIGLVTSPDRTGAPVTITTPAAPVRSCTEQVGPGFRDLLTAELYRAWEIVESGAPGLSAPPDAHRAHAAWALVSVPHHLVGPVRGRIRALLAALEAAGAADVRAWPRPVERRPDAVRFAIGLGRHPAPAGVFADVVASWRSGLRGVDVVRVGNGDVPTLR
ncbi:poly(A) polymerase [Actinosynnema sp. NPDC051121]